MKDISKEMHNRIAKAMNSTWQAIGSDCLRCLEECGEKPIMPRDEVIEMVCDADRMSMYGGDKEAYEASKKLSYDDLKKIGKTAFPFKRYGW